MSEREAAVTFQGNPLTLVGNEVELNSVAPDFEVLNNELGKVSFPADFKGKVCLICSVPSLDTPVCDLEMQRFNKEAAKLGDEVAVILVSMDLPFAQARWCGANSADNIVSLSDYITKDFGLGYGVLIKELRLLSRAVFVVDRNATIRYKEIVSEITNEPDYEAALAAVKSLI